MIRPTKIDHVCLLVKNVNKASKYYEDLFDIACKPYPNKEKMLMVESDKIHFFIKEANFSPKLIREQHLSFEVENLDKIIKFLKAKRIQYARGVFKNFKNKNYKWVEWRDPDGIRLECVQTL